MNLNPQVPMVGWLCLQPGFVLISCLWSP